MGVAPGVAVRSLIFAEICNFSVGKVGAVGTEGFLGAAFLFGASSCCSRLRHTRSYEVVVHGVLFCLFTGEWTTALSRKEKKMRGKKDERAEKVLDDGWPEEASPDVSQQVQTKPPEPLPEPDSPSGDVLESKKPLEQRTTKKDKKRKVGTCRLHVTSVFSVEFLGAEC